MENRIIKFTVPNEFPRLADAMLYELQKHGLTPEESKKRVMQALIDAFNSVITPDPNRTDVKEFVVIIAHNSAKDPNIKLTHSCWLESSRATDHAKAYGIAGALAQYWGTKLIAEHVNKDDHERAFTDFFGNIEIHIAQFRENERQQKLDTEKGGEEPVGG